MRVIARRTLREFVENRSRSSDHRALKGAADAWYAVARKADWTTMADIKRQIATASIVNSERVVFNVKGNSYRLVVAMDFVQSAIYIKWIGTHRDYDDIDVETVDHGD